MSTTSTPSESAVSHERQSAWPFLLDTDEPRSLEDAVHCAQAATELLELALGGAVLDCEHTMPDEETLRRLHHLAGQVRVLAGHVVSLYEQQASPSPA